LSHVPRSDLGAPIQIPYYGEPSCHRVQPGGAVLVANLSTGKVVGCSKNVDRIINRAVNDILGKTWSELILDSNLPWPELQAKKDSMSTGTFNVTFKGGVESYIHFVYENDHVILDIEPREEESPIELTISFRETIENVFAERDLKSLYSTVVSTMRSILGYERIVLYKLSTSESEYGFLIPVAEDKASSVQDSTFLFQSASKQLLQVCGFKNLCIDRDLNADYEPMCFVKEALGPLSKSQISILKSSYLATDPFTKEYFLSMGIRSFFVMSIRTKRVGDWGLMIGYNYSQPKHMSINDRVVCDFVSQAFFSKLDSLMEVKRQARLSKLLNIHGDLLDLMQNLEGVDTLKGLVASQETSLLSVVPHTSGGAVVMPSGEVHTIGRTPDVNFIKALVDEIYSDSDRKLSSSRDVRDIISGYDCDPLCACGMLCLPLKMGGELLWFRQIEHDKSAEAGCRDWSQSDLEDVQDLGKFVNDILSWATGQELTQDMSMRIHEQRVKSRTESFRMATELSNIISAANAPIFSIDRSGVIIQWNAKMEQLSSLRKEEACGKELKEFCPASFRTVLSSILDDTNAGIDTDPFHLEMFSNKQKSETVHLLLNANVLKKVCGFAASVTFVGQDITESVIVLERCKSVAAEYERLIAQCAVPVFCCTNDGKVNEWNSKMAEITMLKREEVIGKSLVGEIFGNDLEVFSNEMCQKLNEQRVNAMKFCEVACIDVIFKKRNKGVVNLLVSAGARRTTNDTVEGVVFFAQDVTTRQEKELMKKIKLAEEAANEAKMEQLQFLCHEIRNPLNGIMGNISFLQDTDIDDEQFALVEGTWERANQLRKIIDDILDIAKINMGGVELEELTFDLRLLFEALGSHFSEESDTVSIDTSKLQFFNVVGDPFRIQQVLTKIISHSLNHEEIEKIRVEARTGSETFVDSKGRVCFNCSMLVIDDGPGMDSEQLKMIFGNHNNSNNLVDGDVELLKDGALGLSVCKKLALLMGGDIQCESEVGKGTTFNFQLPLRVSNVNEDDVHDFFSSLRNSKGRPRGRPSQRLPRNSSATNLTSTDSNSPIRPISPRRGKVTSQSTPLLLTSKIESDAEPAVVEQPKKAPVTELELKRHQKSLSPPRRLDEETSPRSLVQSKRSRRNTGEDVGVSQERGTSEWDVEGVAEGKWNFTVVREIIKSNQVAVLGCVEVEGVTRQAWGCASVEEF